MEPPNDTSADSYLVPASRTLYVISENAKKKMKIIKSIYIFLYSIVVYCRSCL